MLFVIQLCLFKRVSTIPLHLIKYSNQKLRNFAVGWSIGINKILIFVPNRSIVIFGDIAISILEKRNHRLLVKM